MSDLEKRLRVIEKKIAELEKRTSSDDLLDRISLFCEFCGELRPCICDDTHDARCDW